MTTCTCPDPLRACDPECPLHGFDAILNGSEPSPGTEVMRQGAGAELARQPQRMMAKIEDLAPETLKDIAANLRPETVVAMPNVFKDGLGLTPAEMEAVDMVNHPPHYNNHPSGVECIEITRHMTFLGGNAFKYVFRCEHKNGLQDLQKAEFYLNQCVEHADPIWLPHRVTKWEPLLNLVLKHEPTPYRRGFFQAMGFAATNNARHHVQVMLAAH